MSNVFQASLQQQLAEVQTTNLALTQERARADLYSSNLEAYNKERTDELNELKRVHEEWQSGYKKYAVEVEAYSNAKNTEVSQLEDQINQLRAQVSSLVHCCALSNFQ